MVETQKKKEGMSQFYLSWNLHDNDVKEEGREETQLETARNLLVMKVLSHEQIAQAVGLPIEKVRDLAAEL